MRLEDLTTDDAVMAEIGRRVVALRHGRDMTQQDLARVAGVGRTTVQKLETGRTIQLDGLIKVLRSFGRLAELDATFAEPPPSPLAELDRQRKARRRVRPAGPRGSAADPQGPGWTWADEDTNR